MGKLPKGQCAWPFSYHFPAGNHNIYFENLCAYDTHSKGNDVHASYIFALPAKYLHLYLTLCTRRNMVFNMKTVGFVAAATVASASVIELPVRIENTYVGLHFLDLGPLD